MPAAASADDRRRLRAPVETGAIMASPPLDRVSTLVRANQMLLQGAGRCDVQGRSLSELRSQAIGQALQRAVEYTTALTGQAPPSPLLGPLFVTGHQPQLFHPGVWAKNFAVAALARQQRGTGLNLIVDSDLLATESLTVPRGPREAPRLEQFPFDVPRPAQPWEEATVVEEALFDSFGDRVSSAVSSDWSYRPVLADAWHDAVAARRRQAALTDCFAALRANEERRLGTGNLELPLSQLEASDPFRWFAGDVLVRAGSFLRLHNDILAEYRRRNRVRSRAHPVPELRERNGWIEAPFWVWRGGATQRLPLFVRTADRGLELAADAERIGVARLHSGADAARGVADLAQLAAEGWKIRSRALTTTLFARLFLADLFIHGIGGAKYDEMTDRLMERFYGLTPPDFLTLTATWRLPLGGATASAGEATRLKHELRDLHYNPERLLDGARAAEVRRRKQSLLAELAAQGRNLDERVIGRRRAIARRVHGELRQLRAELQAAATERRARLEAELESVRRNLAARRLLESREFGWCLWPAEELQQLVDRFGQSR